MGEKGQRGKKRVCVWGGGGGRGKEVRREWKKGTSGTECQREVLMLRRSKLTS